MGLNTSMVRALVIYALSILTVWIAKRMFQRGWKHPKKRKPYVHAILRIHMPDSSFQPYVLYRWLCFSFFKNTAHLLPFVERLCKTPSRLRKHDEGAMRRCSFMEQIELASWETTMLKLHSYAHMSNVLCVLLCGSRMMFRGVGLRTHSNGSTFDNPRFGCF